MEIRCSFFFVFNNTGNIEIGIAIGSSLLEG